VTASHGERVVKRFESGKLSFLYNLPPDLLKVNSTKPGGKGFVWQNIGRLYWKGSGCIYGSLGTDKIENIFDFEGHVTADRKFMLWRTKTDSSLPNDVFSGILPTKAQLDNIGDQCDLLHPTYFQIKVTMPPDFPKENSVRCTAFTSQVHEHDVVTTEHDRDMDHSSNMFM